MRSRRTGSASPCAGDGGQQPARAGPGAGADRGADRGGASDAGVGRVKLNTSQHTQGFYARFGFETEAVTPDGYAPGIDRWDMVLTLG